MKVLIYADEGVSPFSLQETLNTFREFFSQVELVNHQVLNDAAWEQETSLLIIPGGRDIPYDRLLKGKGTAKIRKFVENGGSFLGLCAGAYFGAAEVIFEKGSALEVHEMRDLKFFPGAAVGTLYSHSPFKYESEEGTHPSQITFQENELHLYYNGGCAFKDADKYPEVSILARYKDAENQAAIIHSKIGKGNVILSGVHFEVDPTSLKKEKYHPMTIEKLIHSDLKRKELVTSIINKLCN